MILISMKCKQLLEAISKLNNCFADIRRWMITNKLKINDSNKDIRTSNFCFVSGRVLKQCYLHNNIDADCKQQCTYYCNLCCDHC